MSVEERLHELGIELPEPPPPAGNYIGAVSVGSGGHDRACPQSTGIEPELPRCHELAVHHI